MFCKGFPHALLRSIRHPYRLMQTMASLPLRVARLLSLVLLGTVLLALKKPREAVAFFRFLLAVFLAGISNSCRTEKRRGLYIA